MKATDVTAEAVWENCSVTELARIQRNGSNVTQAALTSITRYIYDLDGGAPSTPIATDSLTIAATIFDSLQTDGRWTKDGTGYNFRDVIDGSNFDTPSHRYRVEYVFVGSGGEKFVLVYEHLVQSVLSL